MERIARMSRMHASSIFRPLFGSTEQKNKTNKKKKKFWSLARKRERNASCKRDQNFVRNSKLFDHHRRQKILTLKLISPMMIKDDDLFAENATFNAPTCSQTHFTHTFIKYVCICSTTIHRVPRERRREICFVEETIEENSTMQFTRRGREEIGRGFKQK